MTGYKIYNGKPHYWRRGVAKRFREEIDPSFTDGEVTSVLGRMGFPIAKYVENNNGKMKVYGLYDSNLIENWIVSRKREIRENLRKRREFDAGSEAGKIRDHGKAPKTEFTNKSMEEIDAEIDKRNEERRRRNEEAMRMRMEAELRAQEERERANPEEDMERVSDELLRKDDVYYEGKREDDGKKMNEEDGEENDLLEEEMKRWYGRDHSLMMTFDQFKKMILHFINYNNQVVGN